MTHKTAYAILTITAQFTSGHTGYWLNGGAEPDTETGHRQVCRALGDDA